MKIIWATSYVHIAMARALGCASLFFAIGALGAEIAAAGGWAEARRQRYTAIRTAFGKTINLSDDFDTVLQRTLAQVWPSPSGINGTVSAAYEYARGLNATCYWADVKYYDQDRANWLAIVHLDRVTTMAQAVTAPESPAVNDTGLLNATRCALDVWLQRDFQNPNWWYNMIGVPQQVTQEMLMLSAIGKATPYEIAQGSIIAMRANWNGWDGANLAWMAQIAIQRGLATNNASALDDAFAAIWSQVVVEPCTSDGIQVDAAYHFHGPQLLSGAYGEAFAQDLLLFIPIATNTHWQMPLTESDIFAFMLTDGDAWMLQTDAYDFSTIGRSVDRPGTGNLATHMNRTALTLIAQSANATYSRAILDLVARLNKQPGAPPLIGNKHFFTADYQSHRRENWTCSVKMHSVRTIGSECDNGENLLGEHLGDGVLNLYSTDPALRGGYEYANVFPLLNWHLLNGVTAEVDTPLLPCESNKFAVHSTSFVGGASDGMYGVAAMDTWTHNLTAHRAWFFFDEAVVALGAGLRDPVNTRVATTLASRVLPNIGTAGEQSVVTLAWANGSVTNSMPDGAYTEPILWLHADGHGFIPSFAPAGSSAVLVNASFQSQTGDWSTIGAYSGNVTQRVLTAWIDHGVQPQNASFAYAIVPNVTASAMPVFTSAGGLPYACMTNAWEIHALANPVARIAEAVFWQPGNWSCSEGGWDVDVQVDTASIVVIAESTTDFTVSLSNPELLGNTVRVTVNRALQGSGCTTGANGSSVISLQLPDDPNYLGVTVSVSCAKAA